MNTSKLQIIRSLLIQKASLAQLALVLSLAGTAGSAWAIPSVDDEDENSIGYNQIVSELSSPKTQARARRVQAQAEDIYNDPFEKVKFHTGLGYATTLSTLQHPGGEKTRIAQSGIQVSFGIDLFSENWIAEGSVRSFGENSYHDYIVGIKEFDLKLLYQDHLYSNIGFHIGGGVAGRYLKLQKVATTVTEEVSTPASVAVAGLDLRFSNVFSVGGEISTHSSMIDDTIDKSAFDATIRFDAKF